MLHFKKTAYNWLTFSRNLPPCYDKNGHSIHHTKFGEIFVLSAQTRDILFLLLNGKLFFAFWCFLGDDFDLTNWMFGDFPFDLAKLQLKTINELLPLADKLENVMEHAISFKLNAGKKVGNYNLAKCRDVTDKSDLIFANHIGLSSILDDIELLYRQIVRTNFSEEE